MSLRSPDVGNSDGARPGGRLRDNRLVNQVNERRACRPDRLPLERRRSSVRELDLAEVRKRHELAPDREVLDDPLRVLLAERLLAREGVRDGLACRLVRDRRLAGRF